MRIRWWQDPWVLSAFAAGVLNVVLKLVMKIPYWASLCAVSGMTLLVALTTPMPPPPWERLWRRIRNNHEG